MHRLHSIFATFQSSKSGSSWISLVTAHLAVPKASEAVDGCKVSLQAVLTTPVEPKKKKKKKSQLNIIGRQINT
ncbi:hypothetical protein QG37_00065 [Candidozyma auris]|uniref:Uncharacterized protein n=1 Tax=Candidozyma auris TaxID=498019 RepID=A0A0L0P8J2_CANAR|nr:hypothetical protein QG37_00065 [[Candida] auris]